MLAVRPWGFIPSWCPHPWASAARGTSPAEIIADTPPAQGGPEGAETGFLHSSLVMLTVGAGWGQGLIPGVLAGVFAQVPGCSASLRLALRCPARSAEGVLKERCWVQGQLRLRAVKWLGKLSLLRAAVQSWETPGRALACLWTNKGKQALKPGHPSGLACWTRTSCSEPSGLCTWRWTHLLPLSQRTHAALEEICFRH